MTAIAHSAAELTLALLLALLGHFQEGLQALQAGRFEPAEAALTQVIDAQPTLPALRDEARLYRADARLQAGKKDAALADLGALLTRPDLDARVRAQAAARFKAAAGDPQGLLPKRTPYEVFTAMRDAAQRKAEPEVMASVGEPLLTVLNTIQTVMLEGRAAMMGGEPDSMIMEAFREMDNVQLNAQSADPLTGRATLALQVEDEVLLNFEFTLHGDRWKLSNLASIQPIGDMAMAGAGEVVVRTPVQAPPAPAVPAVKRDDVPPELQKEIQQRIDELASPDFRVRAGAVKRLREIGAPARPWLEENRNHPVLDVAETIKELLDS